MGPAVDWALIVVAIIIAVFTSIGPQSIPGRRFMFYM